MTFLEKLNHGKTGGEEDIFKYLDENREILKNRDKLCPVTVILDWESKIKNKFDKLAQECDGRLKICMWPENEANPKLDKSFRGLERFYSDRLIDIADNKVPNKISKKKNGIRAIHPSEYEEIKKALWEEIKQNGVKEGDLIYVKNHLQSLIIFQ